GHARYVGKTADDIRWLAGNAELALEMHRCYATGRSSGAWLSVPKCTFAYGSVGVDADTRASIK
ncbi:MAG: hypothetical protein QOF70_3550, partial [Acetobacteraceae bacterium]|nr:hypothetical protein [Acetobacteraceae bacterium]